MYNNNFVVAIKDGNGKTLRETSSTSELVDRVRRSKIYLPFQSEYSIFLENHSGDRALVKIKIDGTEIVSGGVIIPAFSGSSVERFLVDGNLKEGKKFKFVPLSDSGIQNPTSTENGKIEVEVAFEKRIMYTNTTANSADYHIDWTWRGGTGGIVDTFDSNAYPQSISCSRSVSPRSISQKGATVEGSKSKQQFQLGYIGEVGDPWFFEFTMLAPEEPNPVCTNQGTKKKYCPDCGKKLSYDAIYCVRCGKEQPKDW